MKLSSETKMSMAVLAVVSVFCLGVTSVAGQYSRADIQLISELSAVSPGETVRIMCGGIHDQYSYVCLNRNGSSIMRQYSYYYISVTFTRSIVDVSDTGSYTCGPCYSFYKSSYSKSSAIDITVVVLQKPSLSLETSREVPWGQSAQMRCSISTQHQGGTFTLQQLSGSFTETVEDTGTSALFTIPQVDFTHEGAFYCQYQTRVSRRHFTSPQSDTISLSVIVDLVQPNISLSAPDGGLFRGPQGPEVTRGHSLSLVCSTEPQHQGGSFHLIFDGSNSTRTQLAINHSASFYIPEADYSHQGNYSCVYEVTVSSRTFKSRQTAPLTVIVRGSANRYGFHNGAVVLQNPSLSLETSKEVSWGQSARMRCSISTQHLGGTFTLQQLYGSFTETKRLGLYQNSALFTIPQVDFIHQGAYYCQYQTSVSRREFTSSQSNTASISIIVDLVQPNISLSAPDGGLFWGPQGPEVTRGHSLSLICSTEPQHQGGFFHLIFDGSNRTKLAINHSASFHIPEADYSHQGNYSCVYEVTVSSRTFKSTPTAPLTVIVRASLVPIVSGVTSVLIFFVVIPAILCLVKKMCLTDTPQENSDPPRSVSRIGFHSGPDNSDEDEGIYMNTAKRAMQKYRSKDSDGDMEEVYANVEEIHNCSTAIFSDVEVDDIYQNYK
ncbi:uncharacterized protein LOC134074654 [Sardina pilchardus]|uniref:uncharacterized protein LOC134074654 n=1 Tax=Sardina pilchardus TaxID=27697 RepID=UPI002E12A64F